MRAQSAVIGIMLFFVSMIITGAIFLGIVSKTVKLLDAGRMEIEFLTRKAQERIEVRWGWDVVSGTEGYPMLIINNTGTVPIEVVQVRLSVRKKIPERYQWPFIVRGPWIIAENKTLPVGGTLTVKAPYKLDREQVEEWYRNNMTRILEARILTRYGNVFRTVYVPSPHRTEDKAGGYGTLLFYWSAPGLMDMEGNEWWHGDVIGLLHVSRGVDGARSIDTVAGAGGIQLPKYDEGEVVFSFPVHLPRISGGLVDLGGAEGYLALVVEGIYDTSLPSGTYSDIWGVDIAVKRLNGETIYSAGTGPGLIEIARYSGKALTVLIKLRPGGEYKYMWDDTYSGAIDFAKTIEPGWYIFEIKVYIGSQTSFALKSIALYISYP